MLSTTNARHDLSSPTQIRSSSLTGPMNLFIMMAISITLLLILSSSSSLVETAIIPLVIGQTKYTLNTSETFTIRELESQHSESDTYSVLYNIPLIYQRKSDSSLISIPSMIALFSNTSKAYLVVDPYNFPLSVSNIESISGMLPSLFNEDVFGSEFYIRKLLDWQGVDPSVTPQCNYLANYETSNSEAEYSKNLFYCDNSALSSRHVFILSSKSGYIRSKHDNTCLQYIAKTDSKTNQYIVFQFRSCELSPLQLFGYTGQYISVNQNDKVLFVADRMPTVTRIVTPPGSIDVGPVKELNAYGRNLQYPYRAYQFYFEPTNGFNKTVTIDENGPYFYPPLSLSNDTNMYYSNLVTFINTNLNTVLQTSVVNRLYVGYQRQKRLPFPIPPDSLLYTYIFLPIAVFIGGFVTMFFCVMSCWIFVYIKKNYCKP
ncbi:hypothetical protein C9374_013405 [Naegleria lovaniensis]|uniref:Uncharacterized protein n=1 Tax=Naegleria lovaniensis TaxID=51637 RepID=A0AA88GZ74_NAELO|nr:uncharacterized protein C9374_013405 [Naegleria lovaniensis]KAG2391920.1 hypothetical protein C9374_013405 [Naegleria lovaniensis]